MNLDLEHHVYAALLGIWLGLMLDRPVFSLALAIILVIHVIVLILNLRRCFTSRADLRNRIIKIHLPAIIITCLIIPSLGFWANKVTPPSSIPDEKLWFLAVIVTSWIISVEIAKFSSRHRREFYKR